MLSSDWLRKPQFLEIVLFFQTTTKQRVNYSDSMARKRTKKRTHVGAGTGPASATPANSSAIRAPKSMVIRIGAGEVGSSVSQLVKDVRDMMEPGTASRLKVSKEIQTTHPVLMPA